MAKPKKKKKRKIPKTIPGSVRLRNRIRFKRKPKKFTILSLMKEMRHLVKRAGGSQQSTWINYPKQ